MKKVLLVAFALVSLSTFAGNMTTKLVVNNPMCYGSTDGSVELYVFGGTAPLTYSWDNGLSSDAMQYDLAAGTYSFTVTDFTGDVVSGSVVVAQPAEISVTPNIIDASSVGESDGSIGLIVTGGTPIYAFNWSNGVQDRNISSLTAGTYDVEITDAAGCMKTFTFMVNEPNGFIAQKPEENKPYTDKGNMDKVVYKTSGEETAIEQAPAAKALVYPNPANNVFNITLQKGTENQIVLINPNGQVVAQQDATGETQMNVSDLANGNYILSIKNENGITNQLVSVLK